MYTIVFLCSILLNLTDTDGRTNMDLESKVADILKKWENVSPIVTDLASYHVITSTDDLDKGRLFRPTNDYHLELIFLEEDRGNLFLGIEPMCTIAHELGHLEYYVSNEETTNVQITKEFVAWELGRKYIESEQNMELLSYYDSYNTININKYFELEIENVNNSDLTDDEKEKAKQDLEDRFRKYIDSI